MLLNEIVCVGIKDARDREPESEEANAGTYFSECLTVSCFLNELVIVVEIIETVYRAEPYDGIQDDDRNIDCPEV
jgi:hypothetical protein